MAHHLALYHLLLVRFDCPLVHYIHPRAPSVTVLHTEHPTDAMKSAIVLGANHTQSPILQTCTDLAKV